MAKMLNYNISEIIPEISKASMPVLEECCALIVNEMKSELWNGKIKADWKRHGVYQSGKNAGQIWTSRDSYTEMLNTIRLVKKNSGNTVFGTKGNGIWVMAGNYKTWWAAQMEYGHGGWKGGARPFFRSGIKKSLPKISSLLQSRRVF